MTHARLHATTMNVARVLQMYMARQKGLNVYILARKSGLSYHTIERMLDGGTDFQFSTLAFICDGLGVTFKEFMEHAEAKKSIKYPKLVFFP